ncbi:hypothetical protein [Saccharopolyspora griseoalba]|uniref:Uncharacterized protein n=1 Tax=Saccharopolyspora griseoalba TaxID=1431848 RepID=A0ABW2LK86_9PSEU
MLLMELEVGRWARFTACVVFLLAELLILVPVAVIAERKERRSCGELPERSAKTE